MTRIRTLYTPSFYLVPTWDQVFLDGAEYLFLTKRLAKAWRKANADRFTAHAMLRGPIIALPFDDDENFYIDHVRTLLTGVGKAYLIAGPIYDGFTGQQPRTLN